MSQQKSAGADFWRGRAKWATIIAKKRHQNTLTSGWTDKGFSIMSESAGY